MYNCSENLFIVIKTQLPVHGRKCAGVGTREDTQRDIDHLQVFRSCGGRQLPRSAPNIVNYRVLKPWNAKMQTLGQDVLLDTS